MGLIVENYSFADFAVHWGKELGRDPEEIATVVAKAISRNELRSETHDPGDPGPSWGQNIPYPENTSWQAYDAALSDHLSLVAKGVERPDFEKLLRYVTLSRTDVANWLHSVGEALPRFWQDLTANNQNRSTPQEPGTVQPGRAEYLTLQKIIAVLTLTLADQSRKFKRGDAVNRLQIFEAISKRLDGDAELTQRLGRGLGRSTVDAHIRRALTAFDEDTDATSE